MPPCNDANIAIFGKDGEGSQPVRAPAATLTPAAPLAFAGGAGARGAPMTVVTRFAPSPTGRLHVGNIRTALHNALFALEEWRAVPAADRRHRPRALDARNMSRRSATDLDWLGLKPDAMVRQSERFALYEREFERLRAAGRVYACYETPEELDLRRKVLLGRGLPPVYERKPDGAPVPEGVAPHWRFKLDHDAPIEWDDLDPRPPEVRSAS